MSDYISREAAEILMCDACEYDCKYHERISGRSLITADGCYHLRDLYDIPAADVAPVVHAHWCEDPVFDNFYYCSHCYAGFKSDYTALVDEKYCGNCGARMDERIEDDI